MDSAFCIVVAVFDVDIRLVFFLILIDEVIVNYQGLAIGVGGDYSLNQPSLLKSFLIS